MRKVRTTINIISKEFQEGVDFTIESKGKIVFYSQEVIERLMCELGEGSNNFFKVVKGIIPSVFCSYEENDRKVVFTFKSKNNKKDSNREIEKNGKGQGAIVSGKFKNPEIEEQKNELMEEGIKSDKKQIDNSEESSNRHFVDNSNNERKSKDGVIKESYYQPRSEEEKKRIIEQNKAQREREKEERQKSQPINLENKSDGGEKLSHSDKNQELSKDKSNSFSLPTKIAIGGGAVLVSVVLVVIVRKINKNIWR